jgi:Animal haem peroxidase
MVTGLIDALRRVGVWAVTLVDHWIGWHHLSPLFGLLMLVGIRSRLRLENLAHTALGFQATGAQLRSRADTRTPDGTFNDLRCPSMGSAGTPFGRNVPLAAVRPEPYFDLRCTSVPSPRAVSNDLLARTNFVCAGRLNVLAAAWIQFMVHDWFSHGPTPGPEALDQIEIPLEHDDPWRDASMRVPRAKADPTRPSGSERLGPTFPNVVTHWWDASQLYGSDQQTLNLIRTGPCSLKMAPGGKIKMDARNPDLLPLDPQKQGNGRYHHADLTGFNENWWVGLSLLHTLFALEHNRICELLAATHRGWSGEEIFAHARLINAAVLAKIHTVEWTPAILDHPTVHIGMRGIWSGLRQEGGIYRVLAYGFGPEVRDGIRSAPTDHRGVPYSITEEFVSVYRMHALLPDTFVLRSLSEPGRRERLDLSEVVFGHARDVVEKFAMADIAYSFGIQSAGALTLHNFPKALREIDLPNGHRLDLAAVDVLRDRERGVPRYNDLRRLLHRPPVHSFEGLVGREGRCRGWAEELRRLYGNVDNVDTMVGLYAEPKPRGFGFSDTAFRIFLMMAGRRLQSDRFFTNDSFNERVYTKEGIDWIDKRTMADVLRDHLGLAEQLAGVENPFHRWDTGGHPEMLG